MKRCPPNPGFTLIMRMKSAQGQISSSDAKLVAGLIATPGAMPSERICSRVRWRCTTVSR